MNISAYPESELLKIASEFKKHLKDNFPTIKSAYSGLDQGFIYKFKALFYEIQAHPIEPEVDSISHKHKLELEAMASQARKLFLILSFYLQKAFPYDSNIWEAYGYCEMEKVIHDYSKLRICLEVSVQLIQKKRSELRAANCPDSALKEIIGLSERINNKYEEMLNYLEEKETRNKVYHNNLNELFKLMEIVHDAASKSLQDDPESLSHLTFPPKEYIH